MKRAIACSWRCSGVVVVLVATAVAGTIGVGTEPAVHFFGSFPAKRRTNMAV